jgi:hypothetical protein
MAVSAPELLALQHDLAISQYSIRGKYLSMNG